MLSCFTSINVLFDQYNVGKKLKKTLIEVKQDKIWLRLILILTFLCTVKVPKNDLSLHCRRKMKQLSKKELSNVTPASILTAMKMKLVFEKVLIIIFVTSVHSKYIDEEMVQKSLITQFF